MKMKQAKDNQNIDTAMNNFQSIWTLLSIIFNAISFNSEVWFGMTKVNINCLENIDVVFMRKISR